MTPKTFQEMNFAQISAILAMSFGGFSSGAHLAWPSPSIPHLISNSSYIGQITIEEASYFAMISPFLMLISSFIIYILMKFIGRKLLTGFMAIPYALAWILIAMAKNVVPIYIARALVGISDSIMFSTITAYIAEIATTTTRGTLGSMLMCSVYFGNLMISIVQTYFDIRATALIFLLAPILQLLLITFTPESPHFLIMVGKNDKAKRALQQIRGKTNIEAEFESLNKFIQQEISEPGTFKDLLITPTHRKALFMCLILRTFQQFSGFNAFTIYAQHMFQLAGAEDVSAQLSAIIFFVVLLVLFIFVSYVLEGIGRKTRLIISSFGTTATLLVETIHFYIQKETYVDLSKLNWVPLTGMIIYVIFFVAGFATLPLIITGELFSTKIKNHAMLILTSYSAILIMLVPKMFQLLYLSLYIPFFLFSVSCFMCIIFSYCCMLETRGKTFEEIQILLGQAYNSVNVI